MFAKKICAELCPKGVQGQTNAVANAHVVKSKSPSPMPKRREIHHPQSPCHQCVLVKNPRVSIETPISKQVIDEARPEAERKEFRANTLLSKVLVMTARGKSSIGLETMDLDIVLAIHCYHEDRTAYLNGLGIQLEAFFLIREELLNILALIALKLNHLSHLSINHDGAIASYRRYLVYQQGIRPR